MSEQQEISSALGKVHSVWGAQASDHFGYESDEERKAKRGLEDWELVEKIPESQKPVPYWFFAVVAVVVLVGVGLAFPFWGVRPGQEHSWLDWGFAAALLYIAGAGSFVYFMVRMYGSAAAGRLDSDSESGKSGSSTGQPSGRS
ncbi:MAG: hypothetical protein ACYDCF_04455 [Burkholderiales bacterium]